MQDLEGVVARPAPRAAIKGDLRLANSVETESTHVPEGHIGQGKPSRR